MFPAAVALAAMVRSLRTRYRLCQVSDDTHICYCQVYDDIQHIHAGVNIISIQYAPTHYVNHAWQLLLSIINIQKKVALMDR